MVLNFEHDLFLLLLFNCFLEQVPVLAVQSLQDVAFDLGSHLRVVFEKQHKALVAGLACFEVF